MTAWKLSLGGNELRMKRARSPDHSPRPLRNLGNTCYLNATLQLLRAWTALPAGPWRAEPPALKAAIERHAEQFRGGGQHDAHEFLVACLDHLADAAALPQGLLRSTVQCEVTGETSVVDEPFLVLSVALTHPTLAGCVRGEVQKTERLTGTNVWRSPASQQQQLTPRASTKRIEVARWPAGVVLHLKRFRNDSTKQAQLVQCPFAWENRELAAVVLHHGGGQGGHYTCLVKCGHQWYRCDDARVAPISAAQVAHESMQGYLLLYQLPR